MLRRILKRVPVLGPLLVRASGALHTLRFRSSGYWDARYRAGGNSGCGSYGELAQFKAEVINGYVAAHGIGSVVEFGCGDGNQLSLMRFPEYTGLDVSPAAIELCRKRFAGDAGKRFERFDAASFDPPRHRCDLALSLDVIYHLVEDHTFDAYMRALFDSARRAVIIYSDDSDATPASVPHVRHRRFSKWIAANRPEWRLVSHIPNRHPYDEKTGSGSWADFWIYESEPASGHL